MKISKEVKIGSLALLSSVILYLGFNFLKGVDFFSPTKNYYVIYDNIEGLQKSNPVVINGLTVGRVSDITLDQVNDNKIIVTLQVNKEILLGDSTKAMLSSLDLLGGKAIVLELGKDSKTFDNNDTIVGDKPKGFAELIGEKATPLINQLDTTLIKVNNMLNQKNEKSIENILKNLEQSSAEMKSLIVVNKQNLHGITTNINKLTADLVETEKSLKPLLQKMSNVADSLNDSGLKQVVANANNAMNNLSSITAKINNGEGSLGKLMNDPTTVNNLNKAMSSIDSLVVDLQYNPRHYFAPFGKKPKKTK